MPFEFATATRIIFGAGKLREAGPLAKEMGRRALVVTGRRKTRAQPLFNLLDAQGVEHSVFSVAGEPTVEMIQQGVAQARREQCDLVIAFGGGAPLDSGKAIAALLNNPGDLLDYLEIIGKGRPITRPSVPMIAIPTTSGTGSEVTRNAVINSEKHRNKVSLRSLYMLPKVALVDPELTYDLPPDLTAATGLDALTQLIEPLVAQNHNPLVDALCYDGIRRAARSLKNACQPGKDPQARESMSVASLFGGMALANAGLGAVHGFAGPIGGMFPAPHGAVCAALLPPVMELNVRLLKNQFSKVFFLDRYQKIAQALTGESEATAEDGVEFVKNLCREIRIPPLSKYGIASCDFPAICEKTAVSNGMRSNPVPYTPEEMWEVLEKAVSAI